MRPTFSHYKLSLNHLFLYTILLLHLLFTVVADDSGGSKVLYTGNLPSSNGTIPSFTLDPGVTRSLTIDLSGSVDKLTISFIEDTYQIDVYTLTIKNNNLPETSQSTTFSTTENLTLSLDTKKNLLVLQGSVKFRMSKIVREKSYNVKVEAEIVQTENVTNPAPAQGNNQPNQDSPSGTSSYYVLAGVLGGLIGLVVSVKLIIYLINRSKNRKPKRSSKKKPSNAREVHPEIPSPTPMFMLEDHSPEIFQKGSINLDDKVASDNEIDIVHHHMVNHKKDMFCSMSSIEGGMSKTTGITLSSSNLSSGQVPSSGSITSVARDLESSRVKRSEPPSKKGTRLESITEEPSFMKATTHAMDSGRREREELRTKGNQGLQGQIRPGQGQMKPNAGLKLPKLVVEKSKSHNGAYLEPEPPKANPQTPITVGDIERLVNRVMLEKARSNDSIEVSESEEEEQDLRPEPANFFCCMMCKSEKRSTVAEPCGHIFACEKCVKKIVQNSKTCKLCSRRVRGYQNMKNNTSKE